MRPILRMDDKCVNDRVYKNFPISKFSMNKVIGLLTVDKQLTSVSMIVFKEISTYPYLPISKFHIYKIIILLTIYTYIDLNNTIEYGDKTSRPAATSAAMDHNGKSSMLVRFDHFFSKGNNLCTRFRDMVIRPCCEPVV